MKEVTVFINNNTLTVVPKRGEHGTRIDNPEQLKTAFTVSQLNRLAETYLGKRFNKVASLKMAQAIFPRLQEAARGGTLINTADLVDKDSKDEPLVGPEPTTAEEMAPYPPRSTEVLSIETSNNLIEEEEQGASMDKESQPKKGGQGIYIRKEHRYFINIAQKIPENQKATPQVRQLFRIFTDEARRRVQVGERLDLTKSELLTLIVEQGFISRNPWNVVMFCRGQLIELGVMLR
jgi:hypothetical protein